MTFHFLVSALILVVALILVAVQILLLVIAAVVVLIIHIEILLSFVLAVCRYSSIPGISGFILCLKQKTCSQSGKNRHGNTACTCFQSTCENTQEAVFHNSIPDSVRQ